MIALQLNPSQIQATSRQLRFFGMILAGIFSLYSLWPLLVAREPRLGLLIASACLALIATAAPPVLLWPYRLWMTAGSILGYLNSHLILIAIFFLVIWPLGLWKRLSGKHVFDDTFIADAETYALPSQKRDPNHLKMQF